MRLESYNGAGYVVIRIPDACVLRRVAWVDDQTMCYALWSGSPPRSSIVEHQAQRILILRQLRLVLIDPVETEEDMTQ